MTSFCSKVYCSDEVTCDFSNIQNYVGSGGFADIYKGSLIIDNVFHSAAFKCMKKSRSKSQDQMDDYSTSDVSEKDYINFSKEIEIMENCKTCPDIIKLYGCMSLFIQPRIDCIVMELADGTMSNLLYDTESTLSACVDYNISNSLGLKSKINALIDILRALEFLHSLGYAHNDLKPQNIFVVLGPLLDDSNHHVSFKLGDFGMSGLCSKIAYSPRRKLNEDKKSKQSPKNKNIKANKNDKSNTIDNKSIQCKNLSDNYSNEIDLNITTHIFRGNFVYQAPEIFLALNDGIEDYCSIQSDLYAFTILMNEWLSGNNPIKEIIGSNIPLQICGGVRPHLFDSCNNNVIPEDIINRLQHLIKLGWSSDPKSRPNGKAFKCILSKIVDMLDKL